MRHAYDFMKLIDICFEIVGAWNEEHECYEIDVIPDHDSEIVSIVTGLSHNKVIVDVSAEDMINGQCYIRQWLRNILESYFEIKKPVDLRPKISTDPVTGKMSVTLNPGDWWDKYVIYTSKVKETESKIKKVIFNAPATIILWKDGTKTVVKCGENEEYDPEKGLAMALVKKQLGNKGNYYNLFRKYLKEVEE